MVDPVIRQLTPDLLPHYLSFFDRDAFPDNPDWAGCFCYFFHADHASRNWEDRPGEANRAAAAGLIRSGKLDGYLAYDQDRVIGWCQAAPRLMIPNLQKEKELPQEDLDRIGAVVCFVIAPSHRRQGIGRALLAGACDGLRAQGLAIVEAYPRKEAKSAAANYHGPMAMYRQAGFQPYRELESTWVVRKSL